MNAREPWTTGQLSRLVAPYVGDAAATLRLTPVATGKHNRSYWVDGPAGGHVLRIAPADETGFLFYERHMMRQEPSLHRLIRSRSSIPVAEIVAYDFDRRQLDRDWMLMRALPGTPLSELGALSPDHRNRALAQTGEQMRRLHSLTAPALLGRNEFGYLGEHRPMEPQSTWQAAFHHMWHLLVDDVQACGAYGPEEARQMRRLLDDHLDHFRRPLLPRLLHMDVWAQNLLVDHEGNLTGLVDFDRALWGDVEIEFAVLDYCGISQPAFWEGYGRPREETPSAQIRRLFYLLYEIQKYMPIEIWRRHNWGQAMQHKERSFELAARLVHSGRDGPLKGDVSWGK